jgi:hypothetical protein
MVDQAEVAAQGPSILGLMLILWVAASSGYCFLHWGRLFPPTLEPPVFREQFAMARISGRQSPMPISSVILTVTSSALIIRLGFPQNVLFFFGAFSRDIVVPRSVIRSVRYVPWFPPWVRAVQVHYEDEWGERWVTLSVHEPQTLLLKLSNID